jgi:hypothetical protein
VSVETGGGSEGGAIDFSDFSSVGDTVGGTSSSPTPAGSSVLETPSEDKLVGNSDGEIVDGIAVLLIGPIDCDDLLFVGINLPIRKRDGI